MTYSFVIKPNNWPDADNYLSRPLIGQRAFPLVPWLTISAGASGEGFQLVDRAGLDPDAAQSMMGRAEPDQCISSNIFFWENGNLIGQAVRDEASGYISLAQPEESEWFI
jgi:hypothetical protein